MLWSTGPVGWNGNRMVKSCSSRTFGKALQVDQWRIGARSREERHQSAGRIGRLPPGRFPRRGWRPTGKAADRAPHFRQNHLAALGQDGGHIQSDRCGSHPSLRADEERGAAGLSRRPLARGAGLEPVASQFDRGTNDVTQSLLASFLKQLVYGARAHGPQRETLVLSVT